MRQACKRMRGGLIVLLALWVVSCTGSPTSPTDIRTPVLSLSSRSSALDAGVGTRACTLGAGFWKTHPHAWPSRFDPNATFYASGKSWIDVLRTPPSGDSYYILGHQFIAAGLKLERLDPDLRPKEIGTPYALAGGYFTDGAHSSFTRTELTDLAKLFENFNEGKRGVPPCS
jgi:hypothetical protein